MEELPGGAGTPIKIDRHLGSAAARDKTELASANRMLSRPSVKVDLVLETAKVDTADGTIRVIRREALHSLSLHPKPPLELCDAGADTVH